MELLISSHSKAYDIWSITYYFLHKNWKSVKVYLGANGEDKKEFVPQELIYINKGEDKSFSNSLMSYLEEIEDEYFILMLDDFVILEEVNNEDIKKAFDFIKSNKGVYLRLAPNPKGDIKINKDFSLIDVKSKVPYITSLQMAIWKKEFLMKLLKYDFNPWEFEIKAGKTKEALENYDKFFVTNYPFVKYTHFIEKGKFYPFIKDLCKKEGLNYNFNREFINENQIQDNVIKKLIRNLIPNKYKNSIRKLLKKEEL